MGKISEIAIIGVVAAGLLTWTYCEYEGTEYGCNKCGERYKPTLGQWINAVHFPSRRYMKCPKCGERSWHKRIRIPQ